MRTSTRRPTRGHATSTTGAVLALLVAMAPQVVAADDLTEDLLDTTVEQLDVELTSEELADELAELLEDAVDVDAVAEDVLDALATSTDPDAIGPLLAGNLVREQARWADVGPVWTRVREMLGEGDGTCAIGDDEPCGLLLRTQLQTQTALQLAERADCDEECAQRLERLQERLELTIRQVEQLGPGAAGPDADVAAILRNAEQARLRLEERVRAARGEGAGPSEDAGQGAGNGDGSTADAGERQGPEPATEAGLETGMTDGAGGAGASAGADANQGGR